MLLLLFVGWLGLRATGTPVPDVAWQVAAGGVAFVVLLGALSPRP